MYTLPVSYQRSFFEDFFQRPFLRRPVSESPFGDRKMRDGFLKVLPVVVNTSERNTTFTQRDHPTRGHKTTEMQGKKLEGSRDQIHCTNIKNNRPVGKLN